jgi:hypothetical protein
MPGKLLYALVVCEDALAQNEQNIADQEVLVARQEAAGASVSLSESLLETFQQLRLSYLMRRQIILRDLAALTKRRIEVQATVGLARLRSRRRPAAGS